MAQQSFPRFVNPLPGYRFIVSVNNILMGFQKISGIRRQVETESYQEGGDNIWMHVFPKSCGGEQLLRLEKGIYAGLTNPLCLAGQKIPGALTVMVTDNQGLPLKIYLFMELIVKAWEIGELSADQNGVLINRFEVSYEYFQIVG